MAPSIQVFVLLCCVVTTSMAGISDWKKAFSQLENKVMVQQEEIKSLHQIIEGFNKRLELLEAKGEFREVKYNRTPYVSCLLVMTILLLTTELMGGLMHDVNLYQ